ncbi:MAG: hypothetical protein Ct9H300mP20_14430 [Gammaproteobacteria bacterium]|nr:MAG: hypothetical protein Ct9H300mP20_14430 [Gammaproteobacteria bacterium]
MNRLIEVYSGHGNSEEFRSWTPIEMQNNGEMSCNLPSQAYLPDCFQAGEIIKERCRVAAGSNEECAKRAGDARQLYTNANPFGLFTVPGYDPWSGKIQGNAKTVFYLLLITDPKCQFNMLWL